MHTHPCPPTAPCAPRAADLPGGGHGDGSSLGEAARADGPKWPRHAQGGGRRVGPRIGAWQLPAGRGSAAGPAQTLLRAAAGADELLWTRAQLAHAGSAPSGRRGRARKHRAADAGWGDARSQDHSMSVASWRVLCASPSSGHQAQRQRSGRQRSGRRTCGSRTDHLGTALTPAWPLARARSLHMCI